MAVEVVSELHGTTVQGVVSTIGEASQDESGRLGYPMAVTPTGGPIEERLNLDPWIRVADDLLRVDDLGWHETVLGRWPGVQCARLLVVGWCRCGGAGGWCVPVGSPARW
jgi:hypothetical protein